MKRFEAGAAVVEAGAGRTKEDLGYRGSGLGLGLGLGLALPTVECSSLFQLVKLVVNSLQCVISRRHARNYQWHQESVLRNKRAVAELY